MPLSWWKETYQAWRRPWGLTLLVTLAYLGWILWLGGGDPLVFVQIGTQFSEGDPAGSEGYDGQFVYYIARDPLNAPTYIDVPAYRMQRIVYPLLARLLAFGQVGLLPWTLLLINVAALAIGVRLAESLLQQYRISIWYALPIGLYAGQLLSIRVDLPEPLALTLVLAAIWFFERQRLGWSIVAFTLAVLTKETMLITVGGYGLYLLTQRQVKAAILLGAGVGLPFAGWQGVLWLWLGSFGVGSGGAGATGFTWIPLGGLLEIYTISPQAFWLFLLLLGPSVILPLGWALWSTGRQIWQRKWHPYTLALAANALILLFIPNSTYREPLAMLRFTTILVALVVLHAGQSRQRRALHYSFLWLFTLVLLLPDPLLNSV